MGEHEPVDLVLSALGPLPVMLPNHYLRVAQDVRDLLETSPFPEQTGSKCVAVTMGVSVLYARLLENCGQRPFRNSHDRAPRREPIPEVAFAVASGVPRNWER